MADAIERIRQLDQERSQLMNTAKKEALDRANQAVKDLNSLGFSYRLEEDGKVAGRARPTRKRRKRDVACPVCKFKTDPPHDARRHRGQGKRKKPFTAAELSEMGLARA